MQTGLNQALARPPTNPGGIPVARTQTGLNQALARPPTSPGGLPVAKMQTGLTLDALARPPTNPGGIPVAKTQTGLNHALARPPTSPGGIPVAKAQTGLNQALARPPTNPGGIPVAKTQTGLNQALARPPTSPGGVPVAKAQTGLNQALARPPTSPGGIPAAKGQTGLNQALARSPTSAGAGATSLSTTARRSSTPEDDERPYEKPKPAAPPAPKSKLKLGKSGLPVELEALAVHTVAEPPELRVLREHILTNLRALSGPAPVKKLGAAVLGLVEATLPGGAQSKTAAANFSVALTEYLKDPTAPNPPPEAITDGMRFIEEYLEAMGRGPLVDLAYDARERTLAAREAKARTADAARIAQQRRGGA